MGERRSQYDVLLAETNRLRAEAEASQRESFEVTEYLRGEILAKDERIAELQVQLNEVSHVFNTNHYLLRSSQTQFLSFFPFEST